MINSSIFEIILFTAFFHTFLKRLHSNVDKMIRSKIIDKIIRTVEEH